MYGSRSKPESNGRLLRGSAVHSAIGPSNCEGRRHYVGDLNENGSIFQLWRWLALALGRQSEGQLATRDTFSEAVSRSSFKTGGILEYQRGVNPAEVEERSKKMAPWTAGDGGGGKQTHGSLGIATPMHSVATTKPSAITRIWRQQLRPQARPQLRAATVGSPNMTTPSLRSSLFSGPVMRIASVPLLPALVSACHSASSPPIFSAALLINASTSCTLARSPTMTKPSAIAKTHPTVPTPRTLGGLPTTPPSNVICLPQLQFPGAHFRRPSPPPSLPATSPAPTGARVRASRALARARI
ncbi:hypothetical protein DFH09DRAFT_1092232 [Mycena vulgaris]|nr:hypothetical protein DFH09DRAFT_1092232 [Mycena vulgaris]